MNNKLLKIGVFFGIVLILSFTLYFLLSKYNKQTEESIEVISEEHYPAIRVYIYNGCGFQGVANRINEYLIDKNIDVVNTRNAQRFVYDESIIVVKHDDKKDLKRLQNMTGIKNVIYAVNSNFDVPFIIIAGKDYEKYFTINRR